MSEGKAVDSKNVRERMMAKTMEHLRSEIGDSEMYLNAAIAMEDAKDADERIVSGLYEMAKDEYSHAYFLREYLLEHEEAIPEECEKAFKSLEMHIRRVFQR